MKTFALRVYALSLALLLTGCVLSGCTGGHISPPVSIHLDLPGRAMGGEQPITGAAIHLYQVGTAGNSSQATDLLTNPVTTSDGTGVGGDESNKFNHMVAGGFHLTGDYLCPATDDLVYLAAVGGNPGAGTNDSHAGLVALGHCADLHSSTFINVNEVTTVGTIAALHNFMSYHYFNIGSDPGDPALASAFDTAAMYINSATGTAPGPGLPAGYDADSNDIRALANVIQTCVNSQSSPSSLSQTCSNIWQIINNDSYGDTPADTSDAVWEIQRDPYSNVAAMFNLQSPLPAFAPTNSSPPPDWTFPILPLPGVPAFSPAPGTYPSTQAITITDSDPTAVIYYTVDGSDPTTASPIYSGGFYLADSGTVKAIAIESGRVTGAAGSASYVINPIAAAAPTFSPGGGTYTSAQTVTFSSTTPQAHYFYTTDGSTPTAASTQYTAPLTVNLNETITAVASAPGYALSPPFSATYTIQATYSNVVTTVAGSGERSYYGNGVYATAAQFSQPKSVARDTAGNLYIADSFNNRIRKVDGSSGIVTDFAGGLASGPVGDDGPATSAYLGVPNGLSTDSAGNVYVGDNGNGRIRRIDTSGTITTVFGGGGLTSSETDPNNGDGGPAVSPSAKLRSVFGTLVDSNGNIFFSDSNSMLIRVVYQGGAAVANLLVLEGVASPVVGNVYTIAGNGVRTAANFHANAWAGDGGLAIDANLYLPSGLCFDPNGDLVFADSLNNHIRRISLSTGIISNVAGGNTADGGWDGDGSSATADGARLSRPTGVVYDPNGNLLFSVTNSNLIRKVNTSGILSTVAGTPVVPAGGGDGGFATSAQVSGPTGIAIAPDGSYFIADTGNNKIRMVNALGYISTFAGSGAADYSAGVDGNALQSEIYGATAVATDAGGNLYITDEGYGNLFKVTASNGYLTRLAGPGSAAPKPMRVPTGVTVDTAGNLYVADGTVIRRIDTLGNETTVVGSGSDATSDGIAGTLVAANPYDVHMGVDGNLYYSENSFACIRKFTVATSTVTTVVGTCSATGGGYGGDGGPQSAPAAKLNSPRDFYISPAGDFYISDYLNQRVRLVYNGGTAAATLLTAQGQTPVAGNIYTIAGNGTAGSAGDGNPGNNAAVTISAPTGLVVDSSGNVFFTTMTRLGNDGDDRVRRIDGTTGVISTYVNATGTRGFNGDGLSASDTQLYSPWGLALDNNGDLLIADLYNRRIRKVAHQ